MTDRLYRSRDDRMLAGVAAGVAEMLDADPSIIRIVWVLLVFLTGGIALVVYIVMAIVVPERPGACRRVAMGTGAPTPAQDPRHRRRARARGRLGGAGRLDRPDGGRGAGSPTPARSRRAAHAPE